MTGAGLPRLEELTALHQRVALAADAAQQAMDHIATLHMATTGGVASGPRAEGGGRVKRTLLGAAQRVVTRPGSGHPLGDQLRRGGLALAELDAAMQTLDAPVEVLRALGLPDPRIAPLTGWTPPSLAEAGTRASLPQLAQARDVIGDLTTALVALDGRLRLAILRSRH